MSQLRLLVEIALRNLFASYLNLIIGGIVLAGTLFFVIGGSLLSSVDSAMSRSIIGSLAGHLQAYSSQSKDSLALFDNWNMHDLASIPNVGLVEKKVLANPNVKTVVPMGINTTIVTFGNTVDVALEKLRQAENQRRIGPVTTPALHQKIGSLKAHMRQIIQVIQGDYRKLSVVSFKDAANAQEAADLARASSAAFWQTFDSDPFGHLEFLENRVASLVPDADQIFLTYVGTDLDAFAKAFDRMRIVDGQAVPAGQRGMLLSKYVYEEGFKLKIARRLDKIHEALAELGKSIQKDPDLRDLVKQNRTQTREIVLQLDPMSTQLAVGRLQGFLGSRETDLAKLLAVFLDTNDANFAPRYSFFYKKLAPLLELYRLKPGETLTIKSFTKSGFVQAANVKVYGTFQFAGLEKSGLAGGMSLMDLMTFRDLYGEVTQENLAETQRLETATGARMVDRDKAETELFGGGGAGLVSQSREQAINDQAELGDIKTRIKKQELAARSYRPEEIQNGMALNLAILLKDPAQLTATQKQLQTLSDQERLNLKILTWQKAAGNLGQFVTVAKAVLYFATFIIFVVALVIINNAVMMATLQRVREIGTLRAIGAQRGFVLAMVVMETALLGLAFGSMGTLLGSGIMSWLGHVGLPAGNEFLYFFFSGPRLYPRLGAASILGAMVLVLVVTCISALYPALVAARVAPVRAMQTED